MRFDVPTLEARGPVDEARPLLDGPVAFAIVGQHRARGTEPGLEADGSLAAHMRWIKRRVHELGEEAGLPHEHLVPVASASVIRDELADPRALLDASAWDTGSASPGGCVRP